MTPTPHAGHTWLVECFAPGLRTDRLPDMAREAAAAAARVSAAGDAVEYLGATLVPEDEVILLGFRAASVDAVRAATATLRIDCGRIVASVAVEPAPSAERRSADLLGPERPRSPAPGRSAVPLVTDGRRRAGPHCPCCPAGAATMAVP